GSPVRLPVCRTDPTVEHGGLHRLPLAAVGAVDGPAADGMSGLPLPAVVLPGPRTHGGRLPGDVHPVRHPHPVLYRLAHPADALRSGGHAGSGCRGLRLPALRADGRAGAVPADPAGEPAGGRRAAARPGPGLLSDLVDPELAVLRRCLLAADPD